MTAAIYFDPEGYTTSGPRLMGRNAAGESFLRGFLTYSQTKTFWAQVENPKHREEFAKHVHLAGRIEPVKTLSRLQLGELTQPGTLYFPGPSLGTYAWQRSMHGHAAWSLCGITHTTASARVMDSLVELLVAPVQPWDAVICTSNAVKDNIQRVLQAQADYLHQRLGAQKWILPQLPVIPLGIHSQDFVFTDTQKIQARRAVGADSDTLVVLYVGRLSFHAKVHPLAMYQALEKAATTLPIGKKLLLVECGWHANESIEKSFIDAANSTCPGVQVVRLDGRQAENRQIAWAGADVFCSLSDNIQETFGITPIEAMAAGLPVVVSDWDGYKDTVRDGVDGFRIPTLIPPVGLGQDLAYRHALGIDNYDRYCGYNSALAAVDIEATARAFTRLFASQTLRRQIGEAGRQRAREVYDWSVLIPQYEALWEQLAGLRSKQNTPPPQHPWPARMDPFHAFGSYPTQTLTLQSRLVLTDSDPETATQRLRSYLQLNMVNFVNEILPTESELVSVLNAASVVQTAAGLVRDLPKERHGLAIRSLVWLVKLGLLRVVAEAK